jgi:DNA-binding NarL/FixJ family response regulator
MPIKILLADDHAILRQGLRHILDSYPDFEVVAEAATGLEAVKLAEAQRPDVAVVDIAMKELNGIEATAEIRRVSPATAVLILSMYCEEAYVVRAIRAGASGYLLKDSVEDELVRAIQAVQRRRVFFSPAIEAMIQDGYARIRKSTAEADRFEKLTRTEKIVYQLLAEGNSNKEAAARLNVSVHTVETHRARIMEKLGIHSTAELVLSAVRRGIVS